MSITTKIIAPIWLLGLALAVLAIFIELATLGPKFNELAVRNTNTLARAWTRRPPARTRPVSSIGRSTCWAATPL